MPRQRSKKQLISRRKEAPATEQMHHEDTPSVSEDDDLGMLEKDAEEEELERLVLGDGSNFMAQLTHGANGNVGLDSDNEEDSGEEEAEEDEGLEGVDDADLFFLDSGPSAVDPHALIPPSSSEDAKGGNAPAWDDSDDDRLAISLAGNSRLRKLRIDENEDIVSGKEYTRRLRRQFERLNPVPEWAQAPRPAKRQRRSSMDSDSSYFSDEMDIDDGDLSALPLARLLQDAGSLSMKSASTTRRSKLRPEVLDIQRSRDIPAQPSAIASLSFYPGYPVLLSSGPASTLYLHHIAPNAHPQPHPLLTSVHVRHTPLYTSQFLYPSGDKIFFSGRRKFFHIWDLPTGNIQKVNRIYGQKDEQKTMERFKLSPCGRYLALVGSSRKGGGTVNIISASSTQWIATARIEGKNGVADFAWWSDGEGMTIIGKGGEVGEWSLESRSYLARWYDDGYNPTVLTLGGSHGPKLLGGDRWLVVGSASGIINIYDRKAFLSPENAISISERPTPRRIFDQFTTPASNLVISPDGQLLAMSTKGKADGLRLAHLPSCTVYRNWPTDKTPLGRITALAFGTGSDLLAVGNEAGHIRLFDIRA